MNASFKNSAVDGVSHTKSAFDNERYSTLPNPSGVEMRNTLPEGSVMWDGPSPNGEGTAPIDQGTSTSLMAETVANSPTAMREVNLSAESAPPDTAHKSDEITEVQQSIASSKLSLCDVACANDELFDPEKNSSARTKYILDQIQAAPARVRPWLKSLHHRIQEAKHSSVPTGIQSPKDDQEVQELLAEANTLLDSLEAQRIKRKDTQPSQSTLDGYNKDCKFLDGIRHEYVEETGWPWWEVLMQFVRRKSTFHTYRAALSWRAKQQLQGLVDAFESLNLNLGSNAARSLLPKIEEATHELKSLRYLTYERCCSWEDVPAKKSVSKKHALEFLNDDWLTRFIEQCYSSPTYRNACVLLRFCGMRPEELALGVQLQMDGQMIAVKIQGAKVRETAGQPERKFLLKVEHLPDWFVQQVSGQSSLSIKVNKENFRTYLSGLTERVLQGSMFPDGRKINLSAYLFRHQIANDLRINGWSSQEIAKLLGEVSAETTRHYGNRQPESRKYKPVIAADKGSLSTARPVQSTSINGLEEVKMRNKKKPQSKRKS